MHNYFFAQQLKPSKVARFCHKETTGTTKGVSSSLQDTSGIKGAHKCLHWPVTSTMEQSVVLRNAQVIDNNVIDIEVIYTWPIASENNDSV